MQSIKIYTDLSQSKVLSKMLPPESADMYWSFGNIKFMDDDYDSNVVQHIPCWSLAALLDVLPNNENISTNLSRGGYRISTLEYTNSWFVDYEDETDGLNNCVTAADNPVDACYEMILKLHKQKLL